MREISGRFALKPLEEKRINVRGVKWRFFERLKAPEVGKTLTICVRGHNKASGLPVTTLDTFSV